MITELAGQWRQRASHLREWSKDERVASAYEYAARELEERLRMRAEQELTYAEAAVVAGRARETIARAVYDGRIENAGRRGRPRVRLADVEAVFPQRAVAHRATRAYDGAADARFLLEGRRGGRK